MKFFLITLILCLNFFCGAQTWQKIQDFPGTARDDGASFIIDNKAYCGIGLEVGWTCPNDMYVFDLSSETWTTTASFPANQQRQYATSFVINGKGYVFGGYNCGSTYLNDLWEYSPTSNTWTSKNSLPSVGRSGCVSFVINDTAYIIGGRTSAHNAISECWAYDVNNNSWFQKNDLPNNGLWRGVSFSYNQQGFVGLGKDSLDRFNRKFYTYNPGNGWNVVSNYTHAGRAYTSYTQADSLAYLLGGIDTLNVIDTNFEVLNLKNFTSINSTPFPDVPRKGCMSFCNNSKFYFTTGVSTTTRFNETWKIDLTIGLDEFEKTKSIMVYPNPTQETIFISSKEQTISSLKILDLSGKIVFDESYNSNTISLKPEHLSKGLYILCIELNREQTTYQKLIFE